MRYLKFESMRIPLIYALFGVLWILLSDQILLFLVPNVEELVAWQTFKGWLFVGLSTLVLQLLVGRYWQQTLAAREALARSESRYRLLFNYNPLPMWVYDVETLAFLEVNDAAVATYGYSRDEFLAQTIKDIRPEEDVPLLLEDVAQTKAMLNFAGEWQHRRKDGSLFSVEIISHKLDYYGRSARLVVAKDITEQKQVEAEKSNIFQRNQALVSALGEIVYEWFPQEERIIWEGDYQRILGYSAAEMEKTSKREGEKIHPEDRKRVTLAIEQAFRHKQNLDTEYRFLQQDGTFRWMHDRGVPVYDQQNNTEKLVGVFLDIHDRKQTEEALRQSELRFRHLANNAQDLIYSYALKPEPHFTYVSPSATEITRFTPEEHYQNPNLGYELIHPDDRHLLNEIQQGKKEITDPIVLRWIRKDGELVWTEQKNVPIYNEEGELVALEGIARDITDHVKAQQALQNSESRFRKAVEFAPIPIIIHAEDGEVLGISKTWLEITGYTLEEISSVSKWAELAYGADQAQVLAGIDQLYDLDGRIDEGEFIVTCKDGSKRIWEFSSTPLGQLPDGRRGVISIAVDSTERRQAEKQLHLQSSALNAAANGIVIIDIDGNVEWANPAFSRLTGYSLSEALGKNPRDLVKSGVHDKAFYTKLWRTILSGNVWRGELINKRKNGELYYEEEAITPVWNEAGIMTHFIAIKQDITQRKQVEKEREQLLEQVQQQAEQMNQIMQSVPEGILLLDPSGTILSANAHARAHLTMLTNVAVGDKLTQLGDVSLQTLFTPSDHGNFHEIQTKNQIFEVVSQPLASGPISQGWVLVLRRVTEQKQMEAQLQRQERLAAIGQLAAGIAHDFNNLMAVIILYAQLLERSSKLLPKELGQLSTISQQADRAARLIEQILDFSRRTLFEKRPLDLLILLKEEVKLLQRTLPENIEIELLHDAESYIVQADVTRIQQTIMNLAFNARDAMPEGGKLTFLLSHFQVNGTASAPLAEMQAGDWINFSVIDTGTGIDPAVNQRIFEPFVTTKEPGRGTGLGLSQVQNIVTQHEGFVVFNSQQGVGTTFTIYLPAFVEQTEEVVTGQPETAVSGQGEWLLVVEDEPALRRALVESLSLWQYQVVEAANGEVALEMLSNGTAVDLVISDFIMPKMDALVLVQAARKRNLTMPFIFITGHTVNIDHDLLRNLGVKHVLRKPIPPAQLSHAIANALSKE